LDQFVRKIIAYNFPQGVWEKHGYGEFALEEYDPEVMDKLANTFRTLTETGYMTPEAQEDMDHVRQKMGLSPGMAMTSQPSVDPNDPNAQEGPKVNPDQSHDEDPFPPNYHV
jgi:hypothetical protein